MAGKDDPIRGMSLGALSRRAPRTTDAPRECTTSGCTTMLSRFNLSQQCWLHQRPAIVPLRAPRTAA